MQMPEQNRSPKRSTTKQGRNGTNSCSSIEQQRGGWPLWAIATDEVLPPTAANSLPGAGTEPRTPQIVTRTSKSLGRGLFFSAMTLR